MEHSQDAARFTSIRLVKQRDFCGAIALTSLLKVAQIFLNDIKGTKTLLRYSHLVPKNKSINL